MAFIVVTDYQPKHHAFFYYSRGNNLISLLYCKCSDFNTLTCGPRLIEKKLTLTLFDCGMNWTFQGKKINYKCSLFKLTGIFLMINDVIIRCQVYKLSCIDISAY